MGSEATGPKAVAFGDLVGEIRSRLQRVLVARYGVTLGVDVTAEVEAWAWENFDHLREMNNPLGYLYRVAQSKVRPHLRWRTRAVYTDDLPELSSHDATLSELHDQMAKLTENQRTCVLLVHAYGWTYSEVAETLDISEAAVGNHVARGLTRLRNQVAVVNDPLLANPRLENRNA